MKNTKIILFARETAGDMDKSLENKVTESENSFRQLQIPVSNKDDIVDNIFKIHLNEQVLELSNDFCKYYYASNIDDGKEYFAVIYEDNFVPPVQTVDFLSKNHIAGLNKVIAYSIVTISSDNTQKFVVIVDSYEPGNNLDNLIKSRKDLSPSQVEKLIKKLVTTIGELSGHKIFGYNIKPSNIIMKDNEFLVLREFVNCYKYFYQEDQFLAPELVECHRASRGTYSAKADIYSLGVTGAYALFGKEIWPGYKDFYEYNEARLEHTTYKYLLSRARVPEKFRIFFKQTLHDNASVRWGVLNINEWLNDRISTTIPNESLADNKSIIGFNDRNYSNMKAIAYAMFNHWDKIGKFIKDDKLYKWIGRLQVSNDVINSIKNITDVKSNSTSIISDKGSYSNKFSKLFSLLDPQGGIRVEGLAISPGTIPETLHYFLVTNRKLIAEQVIKIMREELWHNYTLPESAGYLDTNSENIYKIFLPLISNSTSPYKGLERIVYSLNPNARCISKLLDGHYVTSVSELLIALESFAARESGKFTLDRHVIAFIASRLDLRDEIKPVILPSFPKFAEDNTVKALSVLHVVQQHEPEIKLPNIARIIINDLKKLLQDNLHNAAFKKQIMEAMDSISKDGDLDKIIQALSNQQSFINDYNGYYDACRTVKAIDEKIKVLGNNEVVFNGALLFGQKATVLLSYILCFIVTVTVIM